MLTIGAVGGHGGGICGLEDVTEVLPLAPPGLALGVLVRRLHFLERQRRRQHHLRPHHLQLHPPITSHASKRCGRRLDLTAAPPLVELKARGDAAEGAERRAASGERRWG